MSLQSIEHQILARQGERECGDAVFVRRDGDTALIALVDALGHGAHAASVAQRALEVLGNPAPITDVLTVLRRVHEGLSATRGACALVCIIGPKSIEVGSVGNVELRAAGMQLPFVLTPGVLGARMNKPRIIRAELQGPVRLAMFSDGLSTRFHLPDYASLSTADACRAIFERQRRSHDDATLIVADVGS